MIESIKLFTHSTKGIRRGLHRQVRAWIAEQVFPESADPFISLPLRHGPSGSRNGAYFTATHWPLER